VYPSLLTVVLLICHGFKPVHSNAIQIVLDCYMCHRRVRGSTMPVLDVRRDEDDIASAHFLNGTALNLDASLPRRDKQYLAERMCMPCTASARRKSDDAT
jgi:hypothetical protein